MSSTDAFLARPPARKPLHNFTVRRIHELDNAGWSPRNIAAILGADWAAVQDVVRKLRVRERSIVCRK